MCQNNLKYIYKYRQLRDVFLNLKCQSNRRVFKNFKLELGNVFPTISNNITMNFLLYIYELQKYMYEI